MAPPRPLPSPGVPAPSSNEPDTGGHDAIATHGYVKVKAEETKKQIFAKDVQWFIGGCVAAAALVLTAFLALDARGENKADKVEQHLAEHKKEEAAAMAEMGRKLDAIMFHFFIPNPAPTPMPPTPLAPPVAPPVSKDAQ